MVSQNKQYNKFAEEFNGLHKGLDKVTNLSYYSYFDENLKNKTLLDLGCGEGVDIKYFDKLGANSYGIDSSEKMVEISNKKYEKSNNKIRLGYFENIPFKDNTFDVVCSKYSIQTSENIEPIYREVKRVLKKNGEFIFLVVHPIRQFIEKKKKQKDYFKKEIVDSILFSGKLVVCEPTHTISEYLSPYFLNNFEILGFDEKYDPSNAEEINGDKYPAFMIIKARLK